jgi:hypothetical protein
MSAEELAGLVCESLRKAGIVVTLTGGSCASIWSGGKYVSHDLDFIEEGPVPRNRIRAVMEQLDFREERRHFVHRASKFIVEFPTGPLAIGDQRIDTFAERKTATGTLRLLTPTDCVKDRLAAFFHWNDKQSLEQALMVAEVQEIDLSDLRRWSKSEAAEDKFRIFRQQLRERSRN